MPQLRSVQSAPLPNIGSAYIGGLNVGQRAGEVEINARLERQKLDQQMAIAEMEAASKRAALAQDALKAAQELEVQKAYQQNIIGLKQREMAMQEQETQRVARQSLDQMMARESIQRAVEADIAKGATPGEAFASAAARFGATAELPGSAFSDIVQDQSADGEVPADLGRMYDVEGQPGYKYGRTSKNAVQFFPPQKEVPTEAKPISGVPEKLQFGSRIFTAPAAERANKLEKKVDAIDKMMQGQSWLAHRMSITKSKDPDAKLTIADKNRIKEYNDQLAIKAKMESEIESLRSSLTNAPRATLPPSMAGTNQPGGIRIKAIRPAPAKGR